MAPWRGVAALQTGWQGGRTSPPRLAAPVTVSCRATFLAFLIHQRFSDKEKLVVASGERDVVNGSSRGVRPCLPGRPYDEYARALRVLCVHTLPCTVCSPLCWRRTELALLARCISGTLALQRVAANFKTNTIVASL